MAAQLKVEEISPGGIISRMVFPAAFRKRISETRFKQDWRMPGWKMQLLRMGWDGEGDPLKWLYHHMQSFRGPKYQRGSLSGGSVKRAILGSSESVTITNNTFSTTDSGLLCTSRAVFQSDGTLVDDQNGTLVDVTAGEWNSAEPSGTGADWEARYLSAGRTGAPFATPAAAADTWIRIDADRSWGHRVLSKNSPDTSSSVSTFEVGEYLASSADDSAVFTISANN